MAIRCRALHQLGVEQAKRLGVEPVIVPVNTREDANNLEFAAMIEVPD